MGPPKPCQPTQGALPGLVQQKVNWPTLAQQNMPKQNHLPQNRTIHPQPQSASPTRPPQAGVPTHLPALGLVLAVLGEEVAQDVPAAAGDVDQGPLLAQAQPRGHGQHEGDGFDDQRPLAQVASNDETT